MRYYDIALALSIGWIAVLLATSPGGDVVTREDG
jgi:hypothetical protein